MRLPVSFGSAGGRVVVGIRPSDLKDVCSVGAPADRGGLCVIDAVVDTTENLGSEMHAMFPVEGADQLFTARLDADTRVKAGDPIRLALAPERLYVFDADTGRAIR
jgi:ABC-type sugar transport system ATPase subunit